MTMMIGRMWQHAYSKLRRSLRRQPYVSNGKPPQSSKPISKAAIQPLEAAQYEHFFIQLLQGVERGWGQVHVLRVFEALSDRATPEQWSVWLRGYGETLLASSSPDPAWVTRLLRLGELGCGEFSQVAQDIGRQLQERAALGERYSTEAEPGTAFLPVSSSLSVVEAAETTDEREGKAQVWFYQGIEQFNRGDFQGAIASYDKALKVLPNAPEIWYNRGNALFSFNPLKEAIASYDKALELQPQKYQAWNNRGNALLKLGRMEEALASYDQALEICPHYQQAWYNQGVALAKLGRLEAAASSYDKAVELQPNDYQAWYHRGLTLANLGRLEAAIASWDKCLQLKPDWYQAWYNRGVALSNLGRYEEANTSWKKAEGLKTYES